MHSKFKTLKYAYNSCFSVVFLMTGMNLRIYVTHILRNIFINIFELKLWRQVIKPVTLSVIVDCLSDISTMVNKRF